MERNNSSMCIKPKTMCGKCCKRKRKKRHFV